MPITTNYKSSEFKRFIKINFLSLPLFFTKKNKERVLDLGCGWGFYFKINPLAYGIDANEESIKYLKKRKYNAVLGDITKRLPFKDNQFQFIICHDILEHFYLSDVAKIFVEMKRILDKGGEIIIISPNKKGYDLGLKTNAGHKHFIRLNEILNIANPNLILKKHYFFPFTQKIGDFFSHNKEFIFLEKII
jgi:ubiquinone/menaquinone biosynthesis C-methylase UbiE